MFKVRTKFKKGAASFYIVAFSTLILVVIAASFTTVILSEMSTSENDELSQSAYDAALAGIEDAKVAFANYQKCKQGGSPSTAVSCRDIIAMIENPDCGMVAKILGRNSTGAEVLVEEKSNYSGGVANNMQQAYTCVKINTMLGNYTSSLTEDETTRVVRVRLANGIRARQIQRVKISWYSTKDYSSVAGSNYNFPIFENDKNKLVFPPFRTTSVALPPMISVGLVQTAEPFSLNDFAKTENGRTNRGMVFLAPTKDYAFAAKTQNDTYNNESSVNYIGTCAGQSERDCRDNGGIITASQIVKTNDQTAKNFPFAVLCSDGRNSGADFACSTWLELPQTVGGERSDETFIFVVTLPYGQPSTSFSLEFYCAEGANCGGASSEGGASNKAELGGTQVEIDSTGRTNNLYRRILTRMEPADTSFPFPLYAIELLKLNYSPSESLIVKPSVVTSEYTFLDWPRD